MILNIPLGIVLDKLKLSQLLLSLHSSLLIYQISMIGLFFRAWPILPITLFSVAFSFCPLILTCIIIKRYSTDSLGSVLGFCKTASILGSIISHQLIGIFQDLHDESYDLVILYLAFCSIIASLLVSFDIIRNA